ncbi:MAG: hypothetical protein OEV44_09140 [Spirochaetota bacterium]|nr:hypothetical protein [Spirochaetota bacterium]
MKIKKIIIILNIIFITCFNLISYAKSDKYKKYENSFYGKKLDPKWLLDRISQGGDYLCRFQYNNGRFYYTVDPFTGREITSQKGRNYSLVRHFGAILSLLQLYKLTSNDKYLNHARSAIKYALRFAKSTKNGYQIMFYPNRESSGENGFCLIALSWYYNVTKGDNIFLDKMEGIANFILSRIDSDGKLLIGKYKANAKKWSWSQVAIGLMLYDKFYLNHKSKLIQNKVNKMLSFLVKDEISDHWFPQAALLFCQEYQKNSTFFNAAKKWSITISSKMYTQSNAPSTFYIGTSFTSNSSCMVAARSEGFLDVYKLGLIFGDKNLCKRLNVTLQNSIYFLLQHQYTDEGFTSIKSDKIDIDDPNIEGGWFLSINNSNIRIDYVRHSISLIAKIIDLNKINKINLNFSN